MQASQSLSTYEMHTSVNSRGGMHASRHGAQSDGRCGNVQTQLSQHSAEQVAFSRRVHTVEGASQQVVLSRPLVSEGSGENGGSHATSAEPSVFPRHMPTIWQQLAPSRPLVSEGSGEKGGSHATSAEPSVFPRHRPTIWQQVCSLLPSRVAASATSSRGYAQWTSSVALVFPLHVGGRSSLFAMYMHSVPSSAMQASWPQPSLASNASVQRRVDSGV